jgi:hypothetical protein
VPLHHGGLYQLDVRTNAKLTTAAFASLTSVKGVTCESVNLTNPCDLPALLTVDGAYHMKGGDHAALANVTGKLSVSGVDGMVGTFHRVILQPKHQL